MLPTPNFGLTLRNVSTFMELIKIYTGRLVNARELHEFLENKRKFADWIKQRIRQYDFREGESYFTNLGNRSDGLSGKRRMEYYLTLDMAKELAMVENNRRGKEARRYFIEAEKQLALLSNKRLEAFGKLTSTKQKLHAIVEAFGGTSDDFIQIDLNGRKVLYNGFELPDETASTLILKGRDFAIEATNERAKESGVSLADLSRFNEENHADVREVISKNTGKKPEDIPREDSIGEGRLGE